MQCLARILCRLNVHMSVAGVSPLVRRQVGGGRECLAASRTLVRGLAGMRAHVLSQVAGLREGLAARRAPE